MEKEENRSFSVHIKTGDATYRRFKMLCALWEKPISEVVGRLVEDAVRNYDHKLPEIPDND